MLPTIERLARVLRASSRRPVSLDGAYLERVVVNLLDSPGQSEVFLDDLEISPIPEAMLKAWSKSQSASGPDGQAEELTRRQGVKRSPRDASASSATCSKSGGTEAGSPWFPTAIDAPGANPIELAPRGL